MDWLIDLDTQIFLMLHGGHTPWLDSFMSAYTGKYLWVPLYVAMAVLMFKTFGRRLGLLYLLAIGAAIALTDQTCSHLIRPVVERMRPSNPDNPLSACVTLVNGYRSGRYGFPSCHAANAFALVTFMSLLLRRPRLTWFLVIWAVLNCYTRIYLGVHYPGDLLVGAAIGSGYAALMYMVASRIAADSRRHALGNMGKPLFYLPLVTPGSNPLGIGITRGDLLISVALVLVAYISVCAL